MFSGGIEKPVVWNALIINVNLLVTKIGSCQVLRLLVLQSLLSLQRNVYATAANLLKT